MNLGKRFNLQLIIDNIKNKHNDGELNELLDYMLQMSKIYEIDYTGNYEEDIKNALECVRRNDFESFSYENHLFNKTIEKIIMERDSKKEKTKIDYNDPNNFKSIVKNPEGWIKCLKRK